MSSTSKPNEDPQQQQRRRPTSLFPMPNFPMEFNDEDDNNEANNNLNGFNINPNIPQQQTGLPFLIPPTLFPNEANPNEDIDVNNNNNNGPLRPLLFPFASPSIMAPLPTDEERRDNLVRMIQETLAMLEDDETNGLFDETSHSGTLNGDPSGMNNADATMIDNISRFSSSSSSSYPSRSHGRRRGRYPEHHAEEDEDHQYSPRD